MSTPEPHPYRKLNYPINNLEQSFSQEQKLQTRSNIGIPSSVDEEGKVLMVDNAEGELVWAEAPNGLPDIASGDEGKFLSVENGEPAWTDVDIPEQVNADWEATSGVSEILNKPQMKPLVAGNNITINEGASQFTISSTSDPQVNADWDATSGVQEILNKPNLSAVATTGQYADLLGKPDIPASTSELVNDSDFITASEAPVQDVKVDGSSVVDSNGVANISLPQFQQLNSDWDATSGVQEILNRPEVKPLVAGANITITETQSSVEIAGIPTVQLNADWDATSGVQEILNKPDLSIYAEKSDLATVATTGSFNDLADKPTIPSAQVNADWDATSGVSEILNRPNLATVATTGDYSDLVNTPSIPAAQVNSDWSATSGVQEILNKPTVKQVVAGSNITITETADTFEIAMDTPIPSATSDLTNDSGFITLSDLPPEEVAVMTYGTSTIEEYRAAVQSGKKLIVCKISDPDDGWRYVMQSQSSPFPEWSYDIGVVHCQLRLDHNGVTGWTTLTTNSTTSADAGKVFTVDQYGRQVWAAGGGGGGSQVNADWDATSGVAEILNKPTPKTLTAGANISISEGADTLTISAAAGLPASTSADEGKCLVVDSNGDPEWGTGGKTYTGTGGVVVDNVNDTVGLEAPVDLVAGPGITVDNPDGNTVRVSAKADSFFKELYYNATNVNDTAGKVYALSEPITNFMYAKITVDNMEYTNAPLVYEIDVQHNTTTCQWNSPLRNGNTDNTINLPTCQLKINASGNLVLVARQLTYNTYPSPLFTNGDNRGMRVVRVVGIFRIAGGN